MLTRSISLTLALALSAPMTGCLNSDDANRCVPIEPGVADPAGEHSLYVVDSVQFATTPNEATNMSMDFDGAEPLRGDNTLGHVLAVTFGQLGGDLNDIAAAMVDNGNILHLIDVQTVSQTNAVGAGVSVFLGVDTDGDPSDNFSGSESFDVNDPFAGRAMVGDVIDGQLVAQYGAIPMQIALPGAEEPFTLNLQAGRIEARFDGDELTGLIGGVLDEDSVRDELVPVIHAAVANSVSADCDENGCTPDSNGATMVNIFDADGDFQVSLAEVRDNELVVALLEPDIDMYADGQLNPDCDEVTDVLSFSIGFTAVPAQF